MAVSITLIDRTINVLFILETYLFSLFLLPVEAIAAVFELIEDTNEIVGEENDTALLHVLATGHHVYSLWAPWYNFRHWLHGETAQLFRRHWWMLCLSFVIPPLAIYLRFGACTKLGLSIGLTCLGFHAIAVCHSVYILYFHQQYRYKIGG